MKTTTAISIFVSGLMLVSTVALAKVTVSEQPSATNSAPMLIVFGADAFSTPYTPSGWMGNTSAIAFNDHSTESPHSGSVCIKATYKAAADWAGIAWQDPPDDWGDKDGGHNLTGATKLTFWARGAAGGEKVDFYFGAIKPPKTFFDTATGKITVALTTDWKQYTIDLSGKDLSRIKTGFGWSIAGQGHPVTFYLDDIQYE
jgi:hypothetical protein